MDKKRLPIGVDEFADFHRMNYYYVDKTALIKDLLDNPGKVNLFTRPRRFGKSLNISMLKYFFQIETDKSLFDGLVISHETMLCEEYMGKYPVISITLKTTEATDFTTSRNLITMMINEAAEQMDFLSTSDNLSPSEKESYIRLLQKDMADETLQFSLRTLSRLLQKHYGRQTIILIDEYDVPLAKADKHGYYKEMVLLIRNMFDAALKTNQSLFFAVLTGCLRVSKESIFTGLNNLKAYTLLETECDEQFGFTDREVREMLDYYGLSEYYDVTKEWYDGYRIGNVNVYNPWDVVNWCNQLLTSQNKTPKSYWTNSSGNEELQRFIREMGNGVTKAQIERLISGDTVQKRIEEQLTYQTIYDNVENMWSLLYSTGYLTQSDVPIGNTVCLTIPNTEIRNIFRDFILAMFRDEVAEDGKTAIAFCDALKTGNALEAENLLGIFLRRTISIRDTSVRREFKESFYHGILLGIFSVKSNWSVDSNRETGIGYADISIEIEDEETGLIIEVKYAEGGDLQAACNEALKQIDINHYTAELEADEMHTILKYGIAFYKKQCRIVFAS
ncbi:MAG: ATP-binding protein [Clostridiales bacterium]|nr:ATP-binding protein [Clostridiales bacterium]